MATKNPTHSRALSPSLRDAYLRFLEGRFGLRASDQLARSLEPALGKLLGGTSYTHPAQLYQELVQGSRPDLCEALAAQLTVGETHFFRVTPQIEALRRVILPDVVQRRAAERRLAVWSAGCASGEEVYTLAILLREQLPAIEEWDLTLLGTDISHPALEAARRGTYAAWSFRDTPPEVRERYFTREGRRWRLIDAIRRMARFAHLNLADDAALPEGPTKSFDVIMCRNVTIYFSGQAAQKLYAHLATTLAPGGWLVLGPSDPAPEPSVGLSVVSFRDAIAWQSAPQARGSLQSTGSVPRGGHSGQPARRGHAGPTPMRSPAAVAPSRRSSEPRPEQPDPAHLWALAREGHRRSALEKAEALVAADPLLADAHLFIGLLRLEEGDAGQAVSSLRRAIFLDGRNPLSHFTLAHASLQVGDTRRAEAALRHSRTLLASMADDQPIRSLEALSAGELREAVLAQLASLHRSGHRH